MRQIVVLSALLLGSMGLSQAANAGEKVSVKTPLGMTIQADKVVNPAAGTIEHQIIESLKMIRDGQFDKWMDTHCFPSRCDEQVARAQMSNFNLANSKKSAGKCLQNDNEIWVTARKGDPANDKIVKVFVFCGENRMPAPSSHNKLNDKWYVASFSW